MKILLTTGSLPSERPGELRARGQDLKVWAVADDGARVQLDNIVSLTLRCGGRRDPITVELVMEGVEVEQVVAELRALDTFDELAKRARAGELSREDMARGIEELVAQRLRDSVKP